MSANNPPSVNLPVFNSTVFSSSSSNVLSNSAVSQVNLLIQDAVAPIYDYPQSWTYSCSSVISSFQPSVGLTGIYMLPTADPIASAVIQLPPAAPNAPLARPITVEVSFQVSQTYSSSYEQIPFFFGYGIFTYTCNRNVSLPVVSPYSVFYENIYQGFLNQYGNPIQPSGSQYGQTVVTNSMIKSLFQNTNSQMPAGVGPIVANLEGSTAPGFIPVTLDWNETTSQLTIDFHFDLSLMGAIYSQYFTAIQASARIVGGAFTNPTSTTAGTAQTIPYPSKTSIPAYFLPLSSQFPQ